MIMVTGATGKVGRRLVSTLLSAGENVRAVVRGPETARLPEKTEVVQAELEQPESLRPHLDGVDGAFLLWPFFSDEAARDLAPVLAAVLAERIPRIVYLSAEAAAHQPTSFWAVVEDHVTRHAAEWTMLRPVGFAANTLMWADQVRAGDVVRWPFGEAGRSLIHEADIAAVAAKALTEPGHSGRRYLLTGPQCLTQREQVEAIGTALNRPLRWEELDREQALRELTEKFGSSYTAEVMLNAWSGFIDNPEPVTDTVAEITRTPARTFGEWATEHAADFR